MALPNATKTNYGNVDDITPTEQNNIGLNLISLGQKIQKVGDDVWVTTNADYNGANWVRLDVAKAATAVKIGINGSITFWKAAAGANPITWVSAPAMAFEQMGVNGSVTLTAVAQNTSRNAIITHGLGTDNVKVLWGLSASSLAQVIALWRRPDGLRGVMPFPGFVTWSDPSAPASGQVSFNVGNSNAAQDITINYSIVKES